MTLLSAGANGGSCAAAVAGSHRASEGAGAGGRDRGRGLAAGQSAAGAHRGSVGNESKEIFKSKQ